MPNPIVTSYSYGTPPPSRDAEAMALYQNAENRKISRSIQSIVAVVQNQGTTLASASYGATGVKAGTYRYATVTVGQDGRVTQIANGDSPIPKGGLSGQFLASDGNGGLSWRYGASGGGGGGSSTSSTSIIQGPKPVESADLAVSNPTNQTFALTLKPSGVIPGIYTQPTFQVDAQGRIVAASSTPVKTQDTPLPYLTVVDQGDQTEYRIYVKNGAWVFEAGDVFVLENDTGQILTEDGSGALTVG